MYTPTEREGSTNNWLSTFEQYEKPISSKPTPTRPTSMEFFVRLNLLLYSASSCEDLPRGNLAESLDNK
ncbi:hypothetical protein PGT21_006125 [Puccinia graminis f. sp. tritici]|uniref:Uncharacterized protein n=1 Tax=Puccinia graminis f. sp. tritici TaxID=56615 RepID=A0A5B0P4Y0_PUCGR|nr:hypothetical protein PGT21_006125 [Puccinia graminis f. sp. tritici]KAA1104895.1 hypothetical protein PGTUg99_007882 [Puccinia graminis f. sp. tritici]